MTGFLGSMVLGWMSLAVGMAAEEGSLGPDRPLLTPAPKHLQWREEKLLLGESPLIQVGSEALGQVGRLLAEEMDRLYGLRPKLVIPSESGTPGRTDAEKKGSEGLIELFLIASEEGQRRLAVVGSGLPWPPPRNPEEGYIVGVDRQRATVLAATPRGCLYGCLTLLQLLQSQQPAGPTTDSPSAGQAQGVAESRSSGSARAWIPGVAISDWPQLPFRGVHLCIFPTTELAALRQAILWAARFKCNAVVLEPWASLQSRRRPETAYPHSYRPEEIRPLVLLGRAFHMEMIPMLNSWGHAAGMRRLSGEHVVLDRFAEFRDLYEADGWSFRIANPAIYEHLFDRYEELLELFGPGRYFHVGMDEAWGHVGPVELRLPAGEKPHELATQHLLKLHAYCAQRKRQMLMWHDMLVLRGDPKLRGAGPASSIPPYHTHLALDQLPRDIIICAWNYGVTDTWPIPHYFHQKGFPVVVCPWKSRKNTIFLVNLAKQSDLLGVLATTWDSLEVSLPSVAQAAVLAWEPPHSDLLRIPFDHWLAELRKLPLCHLPHLEKTLEPAPVQKDSFR